MTRIRDRRSAGLVMLVALTALFGAVGVVRAAETIGVKADCCEFSQPQFHMSQGEVPQFDPGGEDPHNVTAETRGPDGRKKFETRTVRDGTVPVEGAQYLTSGTYRFVCTIHSGMEADLVVGPEGTPKPRPRVIATVARQNLERVRRTGRVKVSLRSPTGAKEVVLVAKGAGRTLARAGGLSVARGGSRVVRLSLTRRGREALAGRRSVVVTLRTAVRFARATTSSRTVRGG